jgi:meiotically up-regulated gene 157 (Mug157) protein
MYIAAALEKALALNQAVWRSRHVEGLARQLLADIRAGIERFGVVPIDGAPGQKMYAYEVDGLGNAVHDFDDPNLPSLLSIPLLGYRHYDERVYRATRARLLSKANPYYYSSDDTGLAGLGSPHTLQDFIWPLALMVQVSTAEWPTTCVHCSGCCPLQRAWNRQQTGARLGTGPPPTGAGLCCRR